MMYHKLIVGILFLMCLVIETGLASDTAVNTPNRGFLKVYTNYTVENPNSDMELAYYRSYKIFSIDGKLIRVVPRSLTEPQKISIPEGEYKIIANLEGKESDTIRVHIETGKISVIK